MLTLELVTGAGAIWCQQQWIEHHYLHSRIDPRCRPIAYIVFIHGERRGALGFGRPESTRCNGWYGSVEDVKAGKARLTRWEIINLARVWLDPRIQAGGSEEIHNAATQAIGQALKRVVVDYLIVHPPCFLDEPYALRECISYCDSSRRTWPQKTGRQSEATSHLRIDGGQHRVFLRAGVSARRWRRMGTHQPPRASRHDGDQMSLTGTQITYITPAPAHNGTATSNEAAVRIEPAAGTLRALVLAYVRQCGERGATDEEMQVALEMNPSTQRPRRQELEKLGLILRTSRTRPTKSGRAAVIFIATYEVQ